MPTIYNVVRGDGVFFEGMTKEQVYELIAEMTGETVQDVDQAFITKLKEINKGNSIRLWVGTNAEYNALETKENDVLYICTDDTFVDDTGQALSEMQGRIDAFESTINHRLNEIEELYNSVTVVSREAVISYNMGGNAQVANPWQGISTDKTIDLYITVSYMWAREYYFGGAPDWKIELGCSVSALGTTSGSSGRYLTVVQVHEAEIIESSIDGWEEASNELIHLPEVGSNTSTLVSVDDYSYSVTDNNSSVEYLPPLHFTIKLKVSYIDQIPPQ